MTTKDTETKFPWDFQAPETPFWSDVDFKVARGFLACYTPSEINEMHLDNDAGLDKDGKLSLLLAKVQQRLILREDDSAPVPLHESDFDAWQNLIIAIQTIQTRLNLISEAEATTRLLLVTPNKHGKRNMNGVNYMAAFCAEYGPYTEGEVLSRELIPFLQELLGNDSPQRFGATRGLIKCLWKGGKVDEARSVLRETQLLIEGMHGSQYVKYQQDERLNFRNLAAELEAWVPK
jgi:hypothetical protein